MNVKDTILHLAKTKKAFKTSDAVSELHGKYSRQYINSLIRELVESGKLVKGGTTISAIYALPENISSLTKSIKKRLKNEDLGEDRIYLELEKQSPIIRDLPENIASILHYAFTEMLNNAIEHSQSKYVEVELHQKDSKVAFIVNDFGIGVFRNVMTKRKLKSEIDAIQDLLKGKTTTAPQAHSGEGIFFTSKTADVFVLESYDYRLRVDNVINDVFIESISPLKRGTRVMFEINDQSQKHLNDVFKQYQTDPSEYAFDKTEVKVKLYTMGTIYISRSQARRILSGLEKFKSIILDFDKVPTVGQAFADEIFRVFQARHPEITIKPINMVEPVEFMIKRVEKPEQSS